MSARPTLPELAQDLFLSTLLDSGRRLDELKEPLLRLRQSYRDQIAPDFSSWASRAAYNLAYLPHHVATMEQLFAGIDVRSLIGTDNLSVTVLGAGPCPEGLALVHNLSTEKLTSIHFDFVDREIGWQKSRDTWVSHFAQGAETGCITGSSHTVDLANPAGRASISTLLAADLILATNVFTELANANAGQAGLLDDLLHHLSDRGVLVVVDYGRVYGSRSALDRLANAKDLRTIFSGELSVPAVHPPDAVLDGLLTGAEGLWPRSRKQSVVAATFVRPSFRRSQEPHPRVLTQSQAEAVEHFKTFLEQPESRVHVVSGAAGTGKSTLLREFVEIVDECNLETRVLAPTGSAARRASQAARLPASTIHSMIYQYDGIVAEIPTDEESDSKDSKSERPPTWRFTAKTPSPNPAVYLVDEASLIANLETDRDQHEDVIFGNGQVLTDLVRFSLAHPRSKLVFIGDEDQLPPVGESAPQAFSPDTIAELTGAEPWSSKLREVVRFEAGSSVAALANHHRTGVLTLAHEQLDDGAVGLVESVEDFPDWLLGKINDGGATVIAATNANASAWNRKLRAKFERRDELVGGDRLLVIRTDPRTGMTSGDELVVEEIVEDQTLRLRDQSVTLVKVLALYRTVEGTTVRTSLSIVEDLLFAPDAANQRRVSQVLYVNFLMRSGLKPGDAAFEGSIAADEKVNAIRATFAYARTGHRAQGSEWDHVVVDYASSRTFGWRWRYMATSRATKSLHLVNAESGPRSRAEIVDSVAAHLAHHRVRVTETEDLDHGIRFIGERDADRGVTVLYLKNGSPSTAVVEGKRSDLSPLMHDLISEWIEEGTARPINPALADLATRLQRLGTATQIVIEVRSTADYQFTVLATRNGSTATIVMNHNAAGVPTSERSAESKGDIQLLDELRRLLGEARETI